MAEYHIGCGITAIYAGTLNKNKTAWVNKTDVTDEAFRAVAQYCIEHCEALEFDYAGKRYHLGVCEVIGESEDEK